MTISIVANPDGSTVVHRCGELDVTTVRGLRPSLDSLVELRMARVDVDLSQLRMLDTIGMGVLVGCYKRMRALGCQVVLREPRDQPLAICRIVRLDRTPMLS